MPKIKIKPTGKLTPQPWMISSETKAIFQALQANGKEARFVGGCIRNAVFGLPVNDIDIATPETPTQVMKLLNTANIKTIPTGIAHGTVTAVINSKAFEITSLRIDVKNHGRHATVLYTDDWLSDAKRRDFTINSMSSNIHGDIFDPLNGLEDLGKRHIRFVGIAKARIEEDLLRLLRFFRFHATFGGSSLDRDAISACRAFAPRLNELSAERIQSELFKILEAPNPAETLILMKGERILEHFLPEAQNFGRLRTISWLETSAIKVDSVYPNVIRRLAAILPTDKNGHKKVTKRLNLSKMQCNQIAIMTNNTCCPSPEMSQTEQQQALFTLGANNFRNLTLLNWSQELSTETRHPHKRTKQWLDLIDFADNWQKPICPVKGSDLTDLGLKQGPVFGEILNEVEYWWCKGAFKADRKQCMEKINRLLESKN